MALDEIIAGTGTSATQGGGREPFSADWWQVRTPEELRDIIKRGFAGGDAFQGAVAEAERRARDATQRLRELAALEAMRRKTRNRIILVGAIAAVALLVCVGWLLGG